jgi:dolichol kinase
VQNAIQPFIDERDAGPIVVTPLYLLLGCIVPVVLFYDRDAWIAGLGLLAIGALVTSTAIVPVVNSTQCDDLGFGDSAASLVGSQIGKHKWFDTPKSIQGTLAGCA